jgi:hypothetical protein
MLKLESIRHIQTSKVSIDETYYSNNIISILVSDDGWNGDSRIKLKLNSQVAELVDAI